MRTRQRKLLYASVVNDCQAEVQRMARVDASITEGVLHAALENEATLIVMGWRGRPTLAESIFGTVLDEVVWNATIPVMVGRMTTPIDALERVVLVIPAGSLPGGLAGRTADMALAVAKATNVPLLVLAAERYEATLHKEPARLDADHPHSVIRLGHDVVQDVRSNVNARHLVMVTTTGPRLRFRSSLGRIPEHLAAETPGSVVVIHYP